MRRTEEEKLMPLKKISIRNGYGYQLIKAIN